MCLKSVLAFIENLDGTTKARDAAEKYQKDEDERQQAIKELLLNIY
jgi:hypothetical protein